MRREKIVPVPAHRPTATPLGGYSRVQSPKVSAILLLVVEAWRPAINFLFHFHTLCRPYHPSDSLRGQGLLSKTNSLACTTFNPPQEFPADNALWRLGLIRSLSPTPIMAARRLLLSSPWRTAAACGSRPAGALPSPCAFSTTPLRGSSNTSSSTSAIAYKALRRRQAPLPVSDVPPAWSAQAAVSNILYETPTPSPAPSTRHVLNCLVQNEPGVLSRVSGILAARGFNIDSLVVCSTEVEDLSRMTIVLTGQDGVVEQARRQLEDLVPVWAVLDYTNAALVQRELLLAKVNILGPEYFEELLAHHREMTAPISAQDGETPDVSLADASEDFHPSRLAASEALRHKHEHLKSITYFTHQFGGKVLDISTNSCIVEV